MKGQGANLNAQNSLGTTPAHVAAQNAQVNVLHALKILGAKLDTPNNIGTRPVHFAAIKGRVEVLNAMNALGVDLDIPNNDGATPAFFAAQEGHIESLRYLIDSECRLAVTLSSSAEKLKFYSKERSLDVQERFKAHIEKHTNILGTDKDVIPISITDIAFIMGHQDCLTLIQESIVQRQRKRERIPSFFAGLSSEGISEEQKKVSNSADISNCDLSVQSLSSLN